MSLTEDALAYHEQGRPGKTSVTPTKPLKTQRDLSLAYSPGVAAPVLAIKENADDAYRYTNKGNLVGIISNGTATLGLGNTGALACKPVMEGKACLFHMAAGIDVFDLEVDTEDVARFIDVVAALEPTFGAICLEDIKAPLCFVIETALQKRLKIPVFHDDQHGTAVVVTAALINALELQGKTFENATIVINGSGAAGIAIARLLLEMGVQKEHLTLCDSQGVISKAREADLPDWKKPWMRETDQKTIGDALNGADVFIGVSVADALTPEMIIAMAPKPVILALANPVPEIAYDKTKVARPDAVVATGRSDNPNQINNVLCFPGFFKGLLESRAMQVKRPMLSAAAKAIAALAREPVPASVLEAYNMPSLTFGNDYIAPKPLDPRVSPAVAAAVSAWVDRKAKRQ